MTRIDPHRVRRAAEILVAAGIASLALWLHVLLPDDSDLDHDEAISMLAITGHEEEFQRAGPLERMPLADLHRLALIEPGYGLDELLRGLRDQDIHPPAFFLLGRAWAELGRLAGVPIAAPGGGPDATRRVDRWMTRLCGLLVVAAVVVLLADGLLRAGARCTGSLAAAATLTLLPSVALQAHNLRPYALLILAAVLSLVLAQRELDRPEPGIRSGAAVALGASLALGCLSQSMFAAFAVGVAGGLLLARGRAALRGIALMVAAAAALSLPWLVFAGWPELPARFSGSSGGLAAVARNASALISVYLEGAWRPKGLTGLAAWALSSAVLLGWGGARARLLGASLAAPLLVPAVYDAIRGTHLLAVDRAAVAVVPAAAVALGWPVSRLPTRVGLALVAAAIVAVSFHELPSRRSEPPGNSWRAGQLLESRIRRDSLDPSKLLIASNFSARGKLLRRIRYLPPHGDVVFLPAKSLVALPQEAAQHDVVVLLWERNTGYGSRGTRLPRKQVSLVRARMEDAGFRELWVRGKPSSSRGWMLWRRKKR